MKLELKHLAPYLPYDLTIMTNWDIPEPYGLNCDNIGLAISEQDKPILRPLSDLTKEIDYVGVGNKVVFAKTFFREHSQRLEKELKITNGSPFIEFLDYGIVEKMFKYHFDVFGLIEKGLAIDKNKLL